MPRVTQARPGTDATRAGQRRRKPASSELLDARRFESFLIELSEAFVQTRADAATSLIDEWLAKLAALIEVDRITLWELSQDGETIFRRYAHTVPGLEHPPNLVSSRSFAWLMEQNRRGKIIAWSRMPEEVPEIASGEREYARLVGVKSVLSIPVSANSFLCVLVFTSFRRYRRWSRATVRRLKLVSTILAGAVARQRAEAALHATEDRNRAILRALPDLMLVLSPDGVYLDCHSRDEADLIMPAERFLGRRIEEVLPADVAGLFRAALSRASRSGGVAEVEYALCIGGQQREYEARMVRREDGTIVGIVRNITDRKRGARELRESEERFRGAFEHSAIGIAIVAPDGHWLQTNPANCRILGYSETELLAMSFQTLTHPDDLALNLKDFHRALRGEIDHYELEKRYIRKDGRTVSGYLTVSVVRDEQRRPLYFVSQLQDLTERKEAQIEIERLRIELAHFGRLALTGQLTASLAHQLMQPIAAIRFNAEACESMIAAGDLGHSEVRHALEDILASCTRAADIVSNVRGLLRKEPGPRGAVNLNRLVEQVIEVTRYELALRKVRLVRRLAADLPEIVGNPIELQQVILNVLLNGAEAAQNAAPDRELVIETAVRGSSVEIAVHDCGPGVEPAILTRMFEPFFTTKPEGMGMGLAICSEIVRGHGGQIWAEINPAGGVTVRCAFPAGPAGELAPARKA